MSGEIVVDLRLRTKSFALDVIRLYATLPKSTEAQVLGLGVGIRQGGIGSGWLQEPAIMQHCPQHCLRYDDLV